MTSRPESVTDGFSAWRIAIASTLLVSFGMGVEYMLWANLRTIADDMSWPRWIPSAAYALEMIGTGVGGILMGRLADKIGTHISGLGVDTTSDTGKQGNGGSTETDIV